MRLGDYEILRSNQWCLQIYRVMPDGFDNAKAKYRLAGDGRALQPVDCYPSTLAAAVRRVHGFMLLDGVDGAVDAGALAALVEDSERRVSELAEAVGSGAAGL